MAGYDGRRSILKKGKGRALLRFVIYLLLLFIFVSVGYIIIVSDGSNTARQDPTPAANTVTPGPSSALTLTPTPAPASAPTPAPTPFTPDPSPVFEMGYSDDVEYGNIEMLKFGKAIACGLITIDAVNEDNFMASLEVSAYAYIKGAETSGGTVYLLTVNEQGMPYKMYTTQLDESDSGDLEQSSFMAKIDVSEYMEGNYSLGVVIINGNRTECALIGGSAFTKNEMDEVVVKNQ
jgi:hypothetical protein